MNIHKLFNLAIVLVFAFSLLGTPAPVFATSQASVQNAPFISCADVTEIPQAECEALVALYNSTNGAGWVNNTDWLTTDTPCSWVGVECGGDHVTKLGLGANQLSGRIPSELGNLSQLQYISLSSNQLSGSIPMELGNLTQLIGLSLRDNQLTGSIPPQLGSLVNLTVLSLGDNQLAGSIPRDFGNLTQLTELNLSGNQLTGNLPEEFGNLIQLISLRLSDNQLSGSIPPQFGNLTQLEKFRLENNLLSGSIPAELGSLTQLTTLNLNNNQLSSDIPEELGNLAQLTDLELEQNQLSGSIPAQLGSLTQLTWLGLGRNQLSGSIPAELGNLTQLTWLGLCGNQLTGSIPAELGNLTQLTWLGLCDNQLSGSVPIELGNLTQLIWLFLHGNQLRGEFPMSITNLVNLTTLTFDCSLISSDPTVIAFLNEKSPGWQANQCGPRFSVEPDKDIIEGNIWPLDSVVTIAVGDPNHPNYTTTMSVNPADQDHSEPWFKADFADVFDLQPGQTVTVFDAKTTKRTTVTIRNITIIDAVTDTIAGVADSGIVSVFLWICDDDGCGYRITAVSPDGIWSVNFAQPGEQDWESVLVDIQPDTNGGIYQSDIDGDGTAYQEWYVLDNDSPSADAGPDQTALEAATIILDASASSDSNADSLTYQWDLDNDGEYDDAGGITTSTTFLDNGIYIVGLQVTDQNGDFDTDTAEINVTNISPSVTIQLAEANNLGVLSGNGLFTDPSADTWTAAVNYGDGTVSQSLALNPDKSFSLNHTYSSNGDYMIEVCVSDDDGGSGCEQIQVIVVTNQAPIADAGGSYSGNEGTTINLSASKSTDPDNQIVLYEWDMDNDGQFDDATGKKPKFKAVDNGVFTVSVRVTDAGGLSSEDSSTVTVKNVLPVITSLTFNSSVRVGVKLNAYAAFKDVGINDTFTATWKWGDGTTSSGAISGNTVNGSHTYTKPGIYLVTIMVKDKDGGVGQAYKLIFVLPKR